MPLGSSRRRSCRDWTEAWRRKSERVSSAFGSTDSASSIAALIMRSMSTSSPSAVSCKSREMHPATAVQEAKQRGSAWVAWQKISVLFRTAPRSQKKGTPVIAVRITAPFDAALQPPCCQTALAAVAGDASKSLCSRTAFVCWPSPAAPWSPRPGKPCSRQPFSFLPKSASSALPPDSSSVCRMSTSWSVSSVQSPSGKDILWLSA
mmetsp:Transcript_46396/g.93641  ORF Transcript_46396/g.93641 Transcript_46396/m.93641 type:complete len:206 (+) Transcript_46396:288-905(+)